MTFSLTFLILIFFSFSSFLICKSLILRKSNFLNIKPLALPKYYGQRAVIWAFFPSFIILIFFTFFGSFFLNNIYENVILDYFPEYNLPQVELTLAKIKNIVSGDILTENIELLEISEKYSKSQKKISIYKSLLVLALSLILSIYIILSLNLKKNVRLNVENSLKIFFFFASAIAVITTIFIIISLSVEAIRFFSLYSIFDFIFGVHWAPNIAIREDQVAATGSFGMIPVVLGTILVAFIAMLVALPIGLFSAIYLAEFSSKRVRNIVKPTLEILAGIPTVVYGYFAALTAAPFLRDTGNFFGIEVSSESALAAGAVMGIMIIPFISSLSDDIIRSVPKSLRDGSLGLGATKAETVTKVVLPAAFSGIMGAFILAASRAIGETMIVVMAAGLSANLTINPFETVTTVTVQIVSLLTGDTEFDDIKTLSAFGLGLALFVITLLLNILALYISRRVSEKYD